MTQLTYTKWDTVARISCVHRQSFLWHFNPTQALQCSFECDLLLLFFSLPAWACLSSEMWSSEKQRQVASAATTACITAVLVKIGEERVVMRYKEHEHLSPETVCQQDCVCVFFLSSLSLVSFFLLGFIFFYLPSTLSLVFCYICCAAFVSLSLSLGLLRWDGDICFACWSRENRSTWHSIKTRQINPLAFWCSSTSVGVWRDMFYFDCMIIEFARSRVDDEDWVECNLVTIKQHEEARMNKKRRRWIKKHHSSGNFATGEWMVFILMRSVHLWTRWWGDSVSRVNEERGAIYSPLNQANIHTHSHHCKCEKGKKRKKKRAREWPLVTWGSDLNFNLSFSCTRKAKRDTREERKKKVWVCMP